MADGNSFKGYVVESNETGLGYYVFVLSYTACVMLLVAPLVSQSRKYERDSLGVGEGDLEGLEEGVEGSANDDGSRHNTHQDSTQSPVLRETPNPQVATTRDEAPSTRSLSVASGSRSGFGLLLRELEKVASAQYPDRDPDFQSQLSGSAHPGKSVISKGDTSLPSAATTSRLHSSSASKQLPALVLDVGGRRWRHRRPIGRVDVIKRAINTETVSLTGRSDTVRGKKRAAKGMSDIASSVLEEETPDVRHAASFNRAAAIAAFRRQRFRRSHKGSISVTSEKSALSSIIDDISPNDAADADDPGRGNLFVLQDSKRLPQNQTSDGLEPDPQEGCCASFLENLLELTTPHDEVLRVVAAAVPLSVGAMSESVFRLTTACFISHFLGTDSMVAYLLVGLFVRLTSEELSGAIIDALASFVQAILFSGEEDAAYLVGQYMQVAVLLQFLLGVPLLLVWAVTMEEVVKWLVAYDSIALIARDYARIVVFNYLFQAIGRTITVTFHICGHEHFESVIDFTASTLQLVAISCIVSLVDNVDLSTVGRIQILIGFASCISKISYPIMRGWMQPFRRGMIQHFALRENRGIFLQLSRATAPLLVGTVLEYGEWEVLTLFLRHLGPAEVAAWAVLGAFWDVLEAMTEGLGEASASQIAVKLAASQPQQARKFSNSVIYLAVVQALFVTSGLYMAGRYLAVIFSKDPTIQHMTNNAFAVLGLANVMMTFSQICWSLIGAQGRFRLATSIVFVSRWLVTIPLALINIFVFSLDVNSVGGALVVGYSTASCALTFVVLRSDWDRVSKVMQEINNPGDADPLDLLGDFDDEDSSDDDDPFGFGSDSEQEPPRRLASRASSRSSAVRHRAQRNG